MRPFVQRVRKRKLTVGVCALLAVLAGVLTIPAWEAAWERRAARRAIGRFVQVLADENYGDAAAVLLGKEELVSYTGRPFTERKLKVLRANLTRLHWAVAKELPEFPTACKVRRAKYLDKRLELWNGKGDRPWWSPFRFTPRFCAGPKFLFAVYADVDCSSGGSFLLRNVPVVKTASGWRVLPTEDMEIQSAKHAQAMEILLPDAPVHPRVPHEAPQ